MFLRTVSKYLLLLFFFSLSICFIFTPTRQMNAIKVPWKMLAHGMMRRKFEFSSVATQKTEERERKKKNAIYKIYCQFVEE